MAKGYFWTLIKFRHDFVAYVMDRVYDYLSVIVHLISNSDNDIQHRHHMGVADEHVDVNRSSSKTERTRAKRIPPQR